MIAKKLLHAPQMALRNDDADDGVSLVTAVATPVRASGGRRRAATVEADADEGEAAAAC